MKTFCSALSTARFWLIACLAALLVVGCGKREISPPKPEAGAASADSVPHASPRNYVVRGRIDLEALTQTLREYVRLKGYMPAKFSEVLTSGFLTNAPVLPVGKRFAIVRLGISYTVVVVDE